MSNRIMCEALEPFYKFCLTAECIHEEFGKPLPSSEEVILVSKHKNQVFAQMTMGELEYLNYTYRVNNCDRDELIKALSIAAKYYTDMKKLYELQEEAFEDDMAVAGLQTEKYSAVLFVKDFRHAHEVYQRETSHVQA